MRAELAPNVDALRAELAELETADLRRTSDEGGSGPLPDARRHGAAAVGLLAAAVGRSMDGAHGRALGALGAARGRLALADVAAAEARAEAARHDYRVTKCHIDGRRYCAVVIDYAREARKGAEATRQGRTYPHVYRAARDGWTRETRSDCYAWIRSQGYAPRLVPSDAAAEARTEAPPLGAGAALTDGAAAARAVGAFLRGGALAAARGAAARYGYSVTRETARTEDGPTYSVQRATPDGGAVTVDDGWMDSASALVSALYRAEAVAVADADADALRELETWRRAIAPETERDEDGAADGPPDALALGAALDAAREIVLDGADAAPLVIPRRHETAIIAALALAAGSYARPEAEGGPVDALAAVNPRSAAAVRHKLAAERDPLQARADEINEANMREDREAERRGL